MKKRVLCLAWMACTLTAQAQFSGQGSGTERDPYKISNPDQLFEVRNDLTAHYKVMNDLDLTEWLAEENPTYGWAAIGGDTPFTGVFDGNNHIIKGLFINRSSSDNQGLFGVVGKGATIKNICLVNPRVTGQDNVGALIGKLLMIDSGATVENNSVVGGVVAGNDAVGGILGFSEGYATPNTEYGYHPKTTITYALCGNFSSAIVSGANRVGGVFGHVKAVYGSGGGPWYPYTYWCRVDVRNNAFQGRVSGSYGIGALIGFMEDSKETPAQVVLNVVSGTVRGEGQTNGLLGVSYNATISSNVCLTDSIISADNAPVRIAPTEGTNNLAYNGTVLMQNKKQQTPEDNAQNGTGMSLRMLHRQTTYEGLGFDFNKQWNIIEGETMPFNALQTVPGTVSSFVCGSRAAISGTCEEQTGKVFVFTGGAAWEAPIIDGKWELTMGHVEQGAKASVAFQTEYQQASIFIAALATDDPLHNAIQNLTAPQSSVNSKSVNSKFFDLLGRPASPAQRGILIRRDSRSDGSTTSVKAIQ